MKRIASALLLVLLLLGLAACGETKTAAPTGAVNEAGNEMAKKQMEVINTFGRTQTDDRIVAFRGENEYLKYVIVYYENGVRKDEQTHYLVFSDAAYQRMKAQYADVPEVLLEDATHHIRFRSGEATGSSYAEDLAIIQKSYDLR